MPNFKGNPKHMLTKKVTHSSPITNVPQQKTSSNFVGSGCYVNIIEKVVFLSDHIWERYDAPIFDLSKEELERDYQNP